MLFKKLVELCKKRNTVELWEEEKTTWLSNGEVYAKLNEDTSFELSDIICIMELSDERAEGITATRAEFPKIEEHIFRPGDSEEIKPMRYSINCDGLTLQPFSTSCGVLFLQTKHMAIFKDAGCKRYYLSEFGNEYIVLTAVDNTVIGMIRPYRINSVVMKEFSEEFETQTALANENNFCGGAYQCSLV